MALYESRVRPKEDEATRRRLGGPYIWSSGLNVGGLFVILIVTDEGNVNRGPGRHEASLGMKILAYPGC